MITKIWSNILYYVYWAIFIISVPFAFLPPDLFEYLSLTPFLKDNHLFILGIFTISFIGWFTWVEFNVRKNRSAHEVITDLFENHKKAITDLQEKFKSTSTDLKSLEKENVQLDKLCEQMQKEIKYLKDVTVKQEDKVSKFRTEIRKRRASIIEKRQAFKEEQKARKEQLRSTSQKN